MTWLANRWRSFLEDRRVVRLAREYGLPKGAIRQMIAFTEGRTTGDVVAVDENSEPVETIR